MYRGERALKAVSRSFRMLKLSQTRSRLLDSTMTNLPALGSAVFGAFSALCSSIVPPGRKARIGALNQDLVWLPPRPI